MLCTKIILVFLLFSIVIESINCTETYCDGTGWEQFRDEKCYKLIQDWASLDQAKQLCAQEWLPQSDASTPRLVSIKSVEEQDFLTDYVFNKSGVEINVWIGAKRLPNSNKFVWDDESELDFTNWAQDSPSDEVKKGCAVMHSQLMKNINGKWKDVLCQSPNYVLCEKLQRWSFSKLQQSFLVTRKKLEDTEERLSITQNELTNTKNSLLSTQQQLSSTQSQLVSTQTDLTGTKSRLNDAEVSIQNTIKNPVPIGFIYVQLSNQPEPSTLWFAVQWKDVTSEYAGLFFRAEGGDASAFGTVQEGNSPRVTEVVVNWFYASQGLTNTFRTTLVAGGESTGLGVFSGNYFNTELHGYTHKFHQSGGEVRPRNTAMRIWKRVL